MSDGNDVPVNRVEGSVVAPPSRTKKKAAHHGLPAGAGGSRRGRFREGKDGAAEFLPGKDAAAPAFDPEEVAKLMDLWWPDGKGDKFLVGNGAGGWNEWPKSMVLKRMRELPGRFIALRPREGEGNSEADRVLLYVMQHRVVHHVLPGLAGHKAGVYTFQGMRTMVLNSPRLILPREGDWSYLQHFIESRLGSVQSPYWHSWMSVAYRALMEGSPGNYLPGQCMVLAGAAGCAKSRLQHFIITPLLGGRSGNPKSYVFGKCDFNDEMIEAEHILMEDPPNTTFTKDRVFFGEAIKEMVVNDTQRLHPKGKAAFMAQPFWRVSISVNDDPDKLRVLPLITPDIEAKLMIFKVESAPIEIPEYHLDGSAVEDTQMDRRRAFRERVLSELPAYAHWLLNEWKIPDDLRDGHDNERFGVKHYHDPFLRMEMFEDTPSSELLALIDEAILTERDIQPGEEEHRQFKLWELPQGSPENVASHDRLWEGTAIDLEKLLAGEYGLNEKKEPQYFSSIGKQAKKHFDHNKCERMLSRLKEDAPLRITQHRTKKRRGWVVSAPLVE